METFTGTRPPEGQQQNSMLHNMNPLWGSPLPLTDDTNYPPLSIEEVTGSAPQGEDGDEDTVSPWGASNVARKSRDPAGSGDRERQTTWSSNNPHLPLSRLKQRKQLTDAEKGTMKARKANLHANKDTMEKDIKEMLARHQTDIEDLAAKHGRKPDYIKKIVTNQTCYKTTRNVSLHNAVIHHKNVEINAGRPLGERVSLNEIQKLAKMDPELQNLSEEKKQELLDALEEHRKLNEHGLQASNMSASLDVKSTMDQIGSEMDKLCGRTGVRAFAFISKGHLTDVSAPGWLGCGDALAFIPAVMKMSVEDFSAKFEHWKGPPPVDSLKAVRAECTALIIKGLSTITGRSTIKMNYLNYETSIVAMYHVKLVGWPVNIPFGNPSNIGDVSSVRALRRALQDGECKWIQLTESQQREHDKELEERRRAGQVIGVKRRRRSDKGGTHRKSGKRLVQDDDEEEEGEEAEEPPIESHRLRPKRQAAAQAPPSLKSRQPTGSDDDNYEDGDDDDNGDNE